MGGAKPGESVAEGSSHAFAFVDSSPDISNEACELELLVPGLNRSPGQALCSGMILKVALLGLGTCGPRPISGSNVLKLGPRRPVR